ncbi:MAG: Re/Si-specific NAD(P)(+) transhydrogenase subunit alpha [Planctomycetota bacterium]|nr:Re/Si-specific NAD(P)(+) transhydrogenase subunit alpha [Planctomycetota bacterium]MDA1212481.1 Re/Si-specific NAD(P)(+) transhydrogenase subunit alpha [Planctomycetota bacterium]
MIVGVPQETFPGEDRVALVPAILPALAKVKLDVIVEAGAGVAAGYPDAAYVDKGARIVADRAELFRAADIVLQVRGYGANQEAGRADLELMRKGQLLVAFLDPLSEPEAVKPLAERNVTTLSMELIPRITRAQSMDALSSMATISGYKAVLIAASALPKMFPMLMTAAGTITPAKVFVIGAGVAGLQAIATARRLGAVVQAYDVRPAVKEQVQSVGATFVELPLEATQAEDKGGYAKAMDEAFYERQRQMMSRVVAENDVVICTAAIPGKKAPRLITAEMVEGMMPGSVIVDLAAETGGNCELTCAGETKEINGVTIIGPVNLPASIPFHASQMYAKNISTLLLHLMTKEGELKLDVTDEIVAGTLLTCDGQIVHSRVRELLSMSPLSSTTLS